MSLSSIARAFVLVGLACLAGACAATPTPKAPEVTAENDLEGFHPDQDVLLIAPDETEAASRPRLTTTKTIGGGPNDTSVDGRRGTASSASTRASATTTSTPAYRGRGYYRSSGAAATAATAATSGTATANYTTAATPAAGGNFPAAPSYGTPSISSTSRH